MPATSLKSPLESAREYYLVFVSIVFGIFLTSWAEPAIRYFQIASQAPEQVQRLQTPETDSSAATATPDSQEQGVAERAAGEAAERSPAAFTPHAFGMYDVVRGILTLLVIISLWWWYGVFIRWFAPARGLLMYSYDFISLAVFAVATGLWTSRSLAFPTVIPVASALIFGRFMTTRPFTRKIPAASKSLRVAMRTVAGIIALHITFSAGFVFSAWPETTDGFTSKVFSTLKQDEALELFRVLTPALMMISILITFYAVSLTEGIGWGRDFLPASFDMCDKLLDPLDEAPSRHWSRGAASNLRDRAYSNFQQRMMKGGPQCGKASQESLVHSTNDLHSQASLALYSADGDAADAITRIELMYFVHWIDDAIDQCKGMPGVPLMGNEADTEIVMRQLNGLKGVIGATRGHYDDPRYFELGLTRLAYGGALFKSPEENTAIRAKHIAFLRECGYLKSAVDPSTWNMFFDISVKTVTEFWFGLEKKVLPIDYSFLFSLLYGPGLYYHDVDEEMLVAEHSDRWGSLDPTEGAKFIAIVGSSIESRRDEVEDPLWNKRVHEVEAFVECFSNVLPPEITDAYRDLVRTWTYALPQSPPASSPEVQANSQAQVQTGLAGESAPNRTGP